MSKQELLALGYSKGLSWIKDAVKPTSIIEEDDYLPRVWLSELELQTHRRLYLLSDEMPLSNISGLLTT